MGETVDVRSIEAYDDGQAQWEIRAKPLTEVVKRKLNPAQDYVSTRLSDIDIRS